ncbi:MAG: hypothetical protein MUE44_29020 [Oscillatoriaceae cyanobacterium Prado104]|jgi:hypothetical protein|nr:hypothetical protein [Oscillatoriaceae cyanobacterium Prado104]
MIVSCKGDRLAPCSRRKKEEGRRKKGNAVTVIFSVIKNLQHRPAKLLYNEKFKD